MTIRIVSDSACDLPLDILEEYNIETAPLSVIQGEIEYLDKVTIQPNEVYDGMRNGIIYKTSQVCPDRFREIFEKHAKNKESVIYIGFSSALSGTLQSAIIAANNVKELYPDFDIEIIDTKAASLGFGLIVLQAAKLAKTGASKEDILSSTDYYIKHIKHIFKVDNLEYLYRGGRVSRTSAVIGGLLNIKPILGVDEEGKLVPLEKARGKAHVLKRMVDLMDEKSKGADYKKQLIGISHSDDLEETLILKEMIEERYGTKDFIISSIGATIGAHTGPGCIALFFLDK
ncbi:MAG: DegV family protein [Tissierellia bacterium]|nr:DegV family protein [Tissierellia bacterium]